MERDEERIPLGFVLFAVGLILLIGVTAVWLIMPELMPRPLYLLVAPYLPTPQLVVLPETAVSAPQLPTSQRTAAEADPAHIPTRLIIPRLNIDAPIEPVARQPFVENGQTYYQWQVPDSSVAGWHNETAVLGQIGNTVLNGHHNIYGELFRYLSDLADGDEIIVEDSTSSHHYRVTTSIILKERGQSLATRLANASWINPTDDERITLISCWPYTDNSHRVIVVAYPIADAGA
ncbi:MAG: sortase [Chloroflexota bacterium]